MSHPGRGGRTWIAGQVVLPGRQVTSRLPGTGTLNRAGAGRGPHAEVRVRVRLEREPAATRFRYELFLETALEPHRAAVMDCIERSPVRATLSQQLIFEAA